MTPVDVLVEEISLSAISFRFYALMYRALKPFLRAHPMADRFARVPLKLAARVFSPGRMLGGVAPNPLHHDGHVFHYRPQDEGDMYLILSLVRGGGYEPETTEIIRSSLGPGMVMVDLGAHLGYFTVLGAKLVGCSGHVFAFEPAPQTRELLARNVRSNGCEQVVTVLPYAVSAMSGRARLALPEGRSGSASIFVPKQPGHGCVEVDTVRLDDFFRARNWPCIHLVKMDVEGAEKAALEGMQELCRKNPQLKLITEINLNRVLGANTSTEEIIDLITSYGFSRISILHGAKTQLELPRDLPRLVDLAKRVNVNILCERE